jgi:hypothetical protein
VAGMIYLGVIVAACGLLFGIALYMETFFIGAKHKDRVRTSIIRLFDWIDNSQASGIVLTLGQIFSGWAATAGYFILSVIYLGYKLYLLALDVKKDVTDDPLPSSYNFLQAILTQHYMNMVYVFILLLIPNTVLVTLLLKLFVDSIKTRRKVRVDCIVIFITYFILVIIGAEYAVDIVDEEVDGLIAGNHIALAGFLMAIGSFLDALDFLDDLWLIVFFPAVAIGTIAIASLVFFYVFKFIKWFAAKYLGVASDPANSPYTFLVATLGIIVSFLALLDEIRKLKSGS